MKLIDLNKCEPFKGARVDERLRGIKIYVDHELVKVLKKLEELGAIAVHKEIEQNAPFLFVDEQGFIRSSNDMYLFSISQNRELNKSDLMRFESQEFLLYWRKVGDTYVADIPLPFCLRAEYVVKVAREIILQRLHGEPPSVGVANIGGTYTDVDSAKRAAEYEYLHKLTMKGLTIDWVKIWKQK